MVCVLGFFMDCLDLFVCLVFLYEGKPVLYVDFNKDKIVSIFHYEGIWWFGGKFFYWLGWFVCFSIAVM